MVVRARHVICTLPLAVLRHAHALRWSPALPAPKLEAMRGLGLSHLNKCIMRFEAPFWPVHRTAFVVLPPLDPSTMLEDGSMRSKKVEGSSRGCLSTRATSSQTRIPWKF